MVVSTSCLVPVCRCCQHHVLGLNCLVVPLLKHTFIIIIYIFISIITHVRGRATHAECSSRRKEPACSPQFLTASRLISFFLFFGGVHILSLLCKVFVHRLSAEKGQIFLNIRLSKEHYPIFANLPLTEHSKRNHYIILLLLIRGSFLAFT